MRKGNIKSCKPTLEFQLRGCGFPGRACKVCGDEDVGLGEGVWERSNLSNWMCKVCGDEPIPDPQL